MPRPAPGVATRNARRARFRETAAADVVRSHKLHKRARRGRHLLHELCTRCRLLNGELLVKPVAHDLLYGAGAPLPLHSTVMPSFSVCTLAGKQIRFHTNIKKSKSWRFLGVGMILILRCPKVRGG
jgi:hypothetical protein